MQRSPSISLLTALFALLLAGAAQARPLDDLRKAKLEAATATLTISETRCAPGTTTNCGKTQLDESFKATAPRTGSVPGLPGFPVGLRLPGKGTGQCYAESPTTLQTAPDGSVQLLGGAAQLLPGDFSATRLAVAGSRRGVRVAWLEPLAPSIECDYFQEPDTVLALPSTQAVPRALVSPTIAASTLKRARFSITIARSQGWKDTAADGTQIAGTATWKLKLDYSTRRSRGPSRS